MNYIWGPIKCMCVCFGKDFWFILFFWGWGRKVNISILNIKASRTVQYCSSDFVVVACLCREGEVLIYPRHLCVCVCGLISLQVSNVQGETITINRVQWKGDGWRERGGESRRERKEGEKKRERKGEMEAIGARITWR